MPCRHACNVPSPSQNQVDHMDASCEGKRLFSQIAYTLTTTLAPNPPQHGNQLTITGRLIGLTLQPITNCQVAVAVSPAQTLAPPNSSPHSVPSKASQFDTPRSLPNCKRLSSLFSCPNGQAYHLTFVYPCAWHMPFPLNSR